jgi:lipopolysaccharide export system protein LptA
VISLGNIAPTCRHKRIAETLISTLQRIISLLSLIALFIFPWNTEAQQITTLQTSDSNKTIQIVRAGSFRQITLNDSTILETLAINAAVKQGNTILEGDSIVLNQRTGIAEVFGNVHINDADTVHTYAQYLRYVGNERIALLKKNVKLTDGKAQLFTEDLEYNLQTGIAKYKNGGKVINGSTLLTSREAVYYSDTKDVFFQQQVKLKDPKYDMQADSLRYNTSFKTAFFISPTHIVSKDGVIDTRSGTYNMETGEAIFLNKTIFRDSTRFISGNKVAFEEKTGMVQVEGNGKFVDSTNKVIVLGNQLLIDKKNSSFLATRKPVMILYSDNDSTYIAADTLFSGRKLKNPGMKDSTVTDTLSHDKALNATGSEKDSIRFFQGFHHVKIFNDSLQAVSDSLYYSTEDSTFKLFKQPVCWNGSSQISGDTMYLFTENQKAKKLQVFYNAMVVNQTKEGFFNQMSGRTLNAFFIEGNIDHIRTKGSPAESIYYPQDDDSAYIGMNRSKGDVIDIFFLNKELNKIKFINDVKGTLYPIQQIPEGQRSLPGFRWLDGIRPKTKLALFE